MNFFNKEDLTPKIEMTSLIESREKFKNLCRRMGIIVEEPSNEPSKHIITDSDIELFLVKESVIKLSKIKENK